MSLTVHLALVFHVFIAVVYGRRGLSPSWYRPLHKCIQSYRQTCGLNQLCWSKGRRPLLRCSAFITSCELVNSRNGESHDDSTVNTVLDDIVIIIIIIIISTIIVIIIKSTDVQQLTCLLFWKKHY